MRTLLEKVLIVTFSLGAVASAQSLGDIARENREKQQTEQASGVTPKVYTNQDLPTPPPAPTPANDAQPMTAVSGNAQAFDLHNTEKYPRQNWAGRWNNQQGRGPWREHIDAQEQRVANLQQRVNQMNAASHGPFGSATFEGPYTRSQAMQMRMTQQTQQRLDQEKQRLDDMQDAARHSGANGSLPH
jgi:hypothetical protein